jgi:hypothetical protein
MATEKIFVGYNNEKVELTGVEKEQFLQQRELDNQAKLLLETEQLAKQTARASAINKLAEVAGLTEEEIEGLIR